jgi:hypothetical protein
MAAKVTVALEDDLDGGPADETVRFGRGGAEHETDLSKKNARAFRQQFAPFLEHARKAGPGQRRRKARTASSRQRSGVRAWQRPGHRGQRPRAHPRERRGAVPSRHPKTLTHARHRRPNQTAQMASGPGRPANSVPLSPPHCPHIADERVRLDWVCHLLSARRWPTGGRAGSRRRRNA